MHSQSHALCLTQRLVSRYLMIGLACLFFCLALSLVLAWRGALTQYASMTVVVPLLILILGGVILRRTVYLNAQIEDQLHRIADLSSSAELALQPLVGAGPAAEGWNTLRERVAGQKTLADLESRLSQSLGSLTQHKLEQVLNSLTDGVAVTDSEGRITLANNALAAVSRNHPQKDLAGRLMMEVLSVQAAKHPDTILDKLREPSRPVVFELQYGADISEGVLRVGRQPMIHSIVGRPPMSGR